MTLYFLPSSYLALIDEFTLRSRCSLDKRRVCSCNRFGCFQDHFIKVQALISLLATEIQLITFEHRDRPDFQSYCYPGQIEYANFSDTFKQLTYLPQQYVQQILGTVTTRYGATTMLDSFIKWNWSTIVSGNSAISSQWLVPRLVILWYSSLYILYTRFSIPVCLNTLLYRLNKTPWCYTVQVLFLQTHSTCFGRQAPIIRSI